ncbi:MAG: hypothetical protein JXN63_05990 [Candidatus Delongbacteria bacterium]|nr:hypothetical protein [Candidatus Delongbacteria bacterium]
MSNEREKKQILEMLQEGKLTAEQAEKLLKALDGGSESRPDHKSETAGVTVSSGKPGSRLKGKFKVEVESADGDNVMVTLPLMLAKLALSMMPAEKMSEIKASGVDLAQIVNNIEDFIDMIDEDIVNVESANGDRVRVYIQR